MKIYKKEDKIIVEIEALQYRSNPYMEKESEKHLLGTYPTLTGLICRYRKDGNHYDEIGLANTIDMDYKGKEDQIGDFVIKWYGGEKEFRNMCKDLGIAIQELSF